jgi:hypothetical protein
VLSSNADAVNKLSAAEAGNLVRKITKDLDSYFASPEIGLALKRSLENINDDTAHDILREWSNMTCYNARLVEHSVVQTGVTHFNTAPTTLGAGRGAKGVYMYTVKYMLKDRKELAASLSVLVDAARHINKYPSIAEDTGSTLRTATHFLQRVANNADVEFSSTEAAAVGLNVPAAAHSHDFEFLHIWDAVRHERTRTGIGSSDSESDSDVSFGHHAKNTGSDSGGAHDVHNSDNDDDDDKQDDDDDDDTDHDVADYVAGGEAHDRVADDHAEYNNIRDDVNDPDFIAAANIFKGKRGTTQVYDGLDGKVPASDYDHYQHRAPELKTFSRDEIKNCMHVVKLTTKQREQLQCGKSVNQPHKGAGRPRAYAYLFGQKHPLARTHALSWRVKMINVALAGDPPPRALTAVENSRELTPAMRRKRRNHVAYFITLFMPSHDDDPISRRSFSSKRWNAFLADLEHAAKFTPHATDEAKKLRIIADARLCRIRAVAMMFGTEKEQTTHLMNWRARCRKLWSESEKEDYKRQRGNDSSRTTADAKHEIDRLRRRAINRKTSEATIARACELARWTDKNVDIFTKLRQHAGAENTTIHNLSPYVWPNSDTASRHNATLAPLNANDMKQFVDALSQPRQLYETNDDDSSSTSTSVNVDNTTSHGNAPNNDDDTVADHIPSEFTPIDSKEYEVQKTTWLADMSKRRTTTTTMTTTPSSPPPRPPLNPKQREIGQHLFTMIKKGEKVNLVSTQFKIDQYG